ncbi:2-C-methyl-D-erythritol 4-phosphate cytidylyltransferase [bacterium]|nr:2-C-methyl-D-erythritol 4-phosphate cytidylyltransferase [bacterium]
MAKKSISCGQDKNDRIFFRNRRTKAGSVMIVAILLASGIGTRFGSGTPKQFLKLSSGKMVLDYSVEMFSNISGIEKIIIVAHPNWVEKILKTFTNVTVISGGKTRRESVKNGLLACPKNTKKVLIHDTARPFVSSEIIRNCIRALEKNRAVTTAVQVADTIVKITGNEIVEMPNRENLRAEQTPQGFDFQTIWNAHKKFHGETTDDIRMVMELGEKPIVIAGEWRNFKITKKEDIATANQIVEGKI